MTLGATDAAVAAAIAAAPSISTRCCFRSLHQRVVPLLLTPPLLTFCHSLHHPDADAALLLLPYTLRCHFPTQGTAAATSTNV